MLKRVRQFPAIQPRRISTSRSPSPYDNFTKLRAIPFRIRPEKAQRTLGSFAAMACGNIGKVLPSFGAFAFPFLGFDFFRPARFSAVYFPAWFVTGEVEANLTYQGVQMKESAWFDNTYIPGSHVAVLSAAPLGFSPRKFSSIMQKTVPFTTFLMHQHGEPVQCIPFSTSPFSILDVAASVPPSCSTTINEQLSIDLSSVKPNLISAYPVLLPLYLAQYEMQGGKDGTNDMFTFILRAHELEFEAIMCESLSKVDSVTRSAFSMFNESVGHESSGEVHTIYSEDPRVSIPDSSMPLNISPAISEWLEELLCSSKNIEVLANSSLGVIGKGDEDLRMREMASEGTSLEDYRKSTRLVMLRKNLLNAWTLIEKKRSLENGPDIQNPRRILEETIKYLEVERAQSAPKWWLEWLALNRPESENTDQSGDENVAGTTPPKDSGKVDQSGDGHAAGTPSPKDSDKVDQTGDNNTAGTPPPEDSNKVDQSGDKNATRTPPLKESSKVD